MHSSLKTRRRRWHWYSLILLRTHTDEGDRTVRESKGRAEGELRYRITLKVKSTEYNTAGVGRSERTMCQTAYPAHGWTFKGSRPTSGTVSICETPRLHVCIEKGWLFSQFNSPLTHAFHSYFQKPSHKHYMAQVLCSFLFISSRICENGTPAKACTECNFEPICYWVCKGTQETSHS